MNEYDKFLSDIDLQFRLDKEVKLLNDLVEARSTIVHLQEQREGIIEVMKKHTMVAKSPFCPPGTRMALVSLLEDVLKVLGK